MAEKSTPIFGCFVVLQEEVGEITFGMEGNLNSLMKTLQEICGLDVWKEIGKETKKNEMR